MKNLLRQIRQMWQLRTPRERVVILILATMLLAVLYGGLMLSVAPARERLQGRVAVLRMQAGVMEQQALALERLRAMPRPPASRSDLGALVRAQIDVAGMSHGLTKLDMPDPNQVTVAFENLDFADWLAWVADMDAQQVRLAACRIDAQAMPGVVNVTASLQRVAP